MWEIRKLNVGPPTEPMKPRDTWQAAMRKHGFDPLWVNSATESLFFEIPDDLNFFYGCQIGNGCECSGARGIRILPHVVWAIMEVGIAIVAFDSGEFLRYRHAGIIPRAQDNNLMPRPGKYKLNPPRFSLKQERGRKLPSGGKRAFRHRTDSPEFRAKRATKGLPPGPTKGKGTGPHPQRAKRNLSSAAYLRGGH